MNTTRAGVARWYSLVQVNLLHRAGVICVNWRAGTLISGDLPLKCGSRISLASHESVGCCSVRNPQPTFSHNWNQVNDSGSKTSPCSFFTAQ